jgi:hypothetical protein
VPPLGTVAPPIAVKSPKLPNADNATVEIVAALVLPALLVDDLHIRVCSEVDGCNPM